MAPLEPRRRNWIVGNASLDIEIREGMRVLALGQRVTTEEACELVAGVLPVRDPFEPPRDMLAAHRDADGARMSSAKSDRDDFLACRRGEISSEEYVRRLEERVRQMNENAPMGGRYYPLYPREDPKRAARRGFWDGVASVFRLGRR